MSKKQVTRVPEYQQLGIEPAEGGRSLLHDKAGMPKVPKAPEKKVLPPDPISSKTVVVKAATEPSKVKFGSKKRGLPTASAQIPTDSFVNVGMSDDHLWYDDKVTGAAPQVIDNNEYVDVEAAQGANPLTETAISNPLIDRMKSLKDSVSHLIPSIDKFSDFVVFKKNLFDERGPIASVYSKITKIPAAEQASVGLILNEILGDMKFEIDQREMELSSEESSETSHEKPVEEVAAPAPKQKPLTDEMKKPQHPIVEVPLMAEGQMTVLVNNRPIVRVYTEDEAKEVISDLLLNRGVDLRDVTILKRLSIEFGIVIGE
jgi:hypothetical protein